MVGELSDLTSKCIRCGFCLEACPTYVISGRETESPRGRIYLARQAEEGKIDWADAKHSFDTCLGCRACEPACPSGVEYRKILDIARGEIGGSQALLNLVERVSDPDKVRSAARLGRFLPGGRIPAMALRGVADEPPVARAPKLPKKVEWPPLDDSAMPKVKGEVYLLEGCAMRVLYPQVHTALRRLLRRVGFVVREVAAGCCGALHLHNGFHEEGLEMANRLMETMSDELPIIVDSAGCGSAMKEYPVGDFSKRVFDASEFLHNEGLQEGLVGSLGVRTKLTYHDACHLGHAQGIKDAPRELLKAIPGIEFVEMEESDVCCGSAGVYNLTQPSRAAALLKRKCKSIGATGAKIVATGNPGCLAWIEQGIQSVKIKHTVEVLEASFSSQPLR